MIHITSRINLIEVAWVAVALFGLFYGVKVRGDAVKDVAVRRAAGINSGRQDLAQLLVVTSSLLSFAFSVWLLCGLLAMMVPSRPVTSPVTYLIQAGLVWSEIALAYMLYYTQKVRRRVLLRDMNSDAVRARAASAVAALEQRANTDALVANTAATEAATQALQNGPMAAQIENTLSTDANTAAIEVHTEIEIKKLGEDKDG